MNKGRENPARMRLRRRELLRLCAIGVGVGLPVVMTLVPAKARAEGSWNCVSGGGAQGSWCGNQRPGWGNQNDRNFKEYSREAFDPSDERKHQGFVFPYSHEWRMRRHEEEERRRKMRGEFNRFGDEDDWR